MQTEFLIPVQITNNTVINCYEIKNEDYFSILKYLQNQDFKNLSVFFENLIFKLLQDKNQYNLLNVIDKVIVLLTLRSICISPEIALESKKLHKTIKKLNINNIIKKLQDLKFEKAINLSNKLVVNLSLPKKLSFLSLDEVMESCVHSITNETDTKILNQSEIKETLSLLPGNFFFEIKQFVQEAEQMLSNIILVEADENFNLKNISCSILSNSIFSFLLNLFSDSLINFYQLIYIFGNKLNLSKSDFDNLTPAESTLLVNFYIKEQEDIAKSSKPQSQSIVQNVDK